MTVNDTASLEWLLLIFIQSDIETYVLLIVSSPVKLISQLSIRNYVRILNLISVYITYQAFFSTCLIQIPINK